MAKVTSKLQVTIPRRIADAYGIAPGDEIEFVAAGDGIRVVLPGRAAPAALSTAEKLRLFDAASARQRERDKVLRRHMTGSTGRGWTRADLYDRDKPR